MLMPGIVSGVMALEMTVDERAPALHMDPLELRLLNRAEQDKYKLPPDIRPAMNETCPRHERGPDFQFSFYLEPVLVGQGTAWLLQRGCRIHFCWVGFVWLRGQDLNL